jgi:acetyltransferase-like isoleucine patch superfamily enzyme
MDISENRQRMARGELYYAFTPELTAARARAGHACEQYNKASKASRRELIELFREYVGCSQTCWPGSHKCNSAFLKIRRPCRLQHPLPKRTTSFSRMTPGLCRRLVSELCEVKDHVKPTPIAMDYGHNVKLGKNIFINFNSVFLDTCLITIGDRTLVGPNCSFYSATHPLDPALRNGLRGPELGKEIHVGNDCWIGGNVVILPGVTIGKGSVGEYG